MMNAHGDPCRIERLFDKYVSPAKVRCHDEGRYYFAWLEITNRCPGTCAYCYVTTIDRPEEVSIPPEKIRELIDDIRDLGVQHIYWGGRRPAALPRPLRPAGLCPGAGDEQRGLHHRHPAAEQTDVPAAG